MNRFWTALIGGALSACVRTGAIEVPDLAEDTASCSFILSYGQQKVVIPYTREEVLSNEVALSLDLDSVEEAALILSPRTLPELQLNRDVGVEVLETGLGRSLLHDGASYFGASPQDGLLRFEPTTDLELIEQTLVAAIDIEACVESGSESGGCFVDGLCRNPCNATSTVAPPAPPDPPVVCPAEWFDCEPYPPGADPDCNGTDRALVVGEGCRAVGAACPVGDWPENLPSSGVVRVSPADFALEVANAAEGSIIALSKGTFSGPEVLIDKRLTFVGACPAETKLHRSLVVSSTVTFRDLSIRSRTPVQGRLALEGIWLEGEGHLDLDVGSTLEARYLWARVNNRALLAAGAHVTLEKAVIHGATGIALLLTASDLTATDIAVRRGGYRGAIRVEDGGVISLSRAVLEDNGREGLIVDGGDTVSVTDSVIRRNGADGLWLLGIERASVERSRLSANRYHEIRTDDASVELRDLVIRSIGDEKIPASDDEFYGGIGGRSSRITAERLRIEVHGDRFALHSVSDFDGSHLTVDHHGVATRMSTISGALRWADFSCFSVECGSDATCREHNCGASALEVLAGTVLSDIRIRGRVRGLTIIEKAQVTEPVVVDRLSVSDVSTGVNLAERTRLVAKDLIIEDALRRECLGCYGNGVRIKPGATADLERFRISRAHANGIATVFSSDVTARDGLFDRNSVALSLPEAFDIEQVLDRVLFQRNGELFLLGLE